MNKIISFFPVLENEQLKDLNVELEYDFSYFDGHNKQSIDYSMDGNFIVLNTEHCSWNPVYFDLNVRATVHLSNCTQLYGPFGVAPSNSILGIGLEWFSQKDRLRDIVVNRESLEHTDERQRLSFNFTLNKDTFKNNVSISLILYLKEESKSVPLNENYLNNEVGVTLGRLVENTLSMSGVGSLFPIYTKPLDSNLLWTIDFDFDDPYVDALSDTVKLTLNSSHKNYHFIDTTSKDFNQYMLFEIIANAMSLLFINLKEQFGIDDSVDESAEDGSIMNLYTYYKNIIGINTTSSCDISNSIREYMSDKEV